MISGDITRGLKRLRQDAQEHLDRIAALDAIDQASGLDAYMSATRGEIDRLEGQRNDKLTALANIDEQIKDTTAELAAIEKRGQSMVARFKDDAQQIMVDADQKARAIEGKATADAATALTSANATAALIVDAAKATANDIANQTAAKQDELNALLGRLETVQAQLDKAESRRLAVLHELGAS